MLEQARQRSGTGKNASFRFSSLTPQASDRGPVGAEHRRAAMPSGVCQAGFDLHDPLAVDEIARDVPALSCLRNVKVNYLLKGKIRIINDTSLLIEQV